MDGGQYHQYAQVPKMEVITDLYEAILVVGLPLHKPYPYSLYVRIPPF